MSVIHVLDSETIDKIAAGEVVERPSSVVKELVENAVDAGATAITVEIKDGGISFLRVTDNGAGIEKDQIRNAFLRHATSKIENAHDLFRIRSLGFRGEALSSIAAVSKVEVITKTKEALAGTRYVLEGGVEKEFEEIGAPEGTTFIVRNLFYNTPVRRKFLKLPATEGGYIAELMEHLALSRPDISFKFQMGSQVRFHTTGNGDLKEVIYRIYGRDIAAALVSFEMSQNGNRIHGYLGKPSIVRSNRNFEIYFINGRFIRSNLIAKALEEGYKQYLMQHKFPFCVLHIEMDPGQVDVNVHPTKMDVRFSDGITFAHMLTGGVCDALQKKELIPEVSLENEKEVRRAQAEEKKTQSQVKTPEPFELNRMKHFVVAEEEKYAKDVVPQKQIRVEPPRAEQPKTEQPKAEQPKAEQITFLDEKILTEENKKNYQFIGQVFDTYWLIQYEDKLMIVDQHAAHEKVKYERLMKQISTRQIVSQNLMPPIIVSLSAREETVLLEHMDTFAGLGFAVEAFGGREYALRSVPVDLFGCGEKDLFLEVLDELDAGGTRGNFTVVEEKIASMACKAAVKGNHRLSLPEAKRLIDELLLLDNPYNCPHGRPTMITMSQYELDKKFKRII